MDLRELFEDEKGRYPSILEYTAWLELRAALFQNLMDRWREWSDATFGEGQRTIPILYHLKKEVPELIEAIQDRTIGVTEEHIRMEFADCFALLVDAASHYGYTADDLLKALRDKLEINRHRRWGKADKDGVVEHIRQDAVFTGGDKGIIEEGRDL